MGKRGDRQQRSSPQSVGWRHCHMGGIGTNGNQLEKQEGRPTRVVWSRTCFSRIKGPRRTEEGQVCALPDLDPGASCWFSLLCLPSRSSWAGLLVCLRIWELRLVQGRAPSPPPERGSWAHPSPGRAPRLAGSSCGGSVLSLPCPEVCVMSRVGGYTVPTLSFPICLCDF